MNNSINGLVLAGGNSSRMGQDKSELDYFGKPQYQIVYDLLLPFCSTVYLSVRYPKNHNIPEIIDDQAYENTGPAAGLLSAFGKIDSAWLVLAIDYPFLSSQDIFKLVLERDTNLDASVYYNKDGYYEPFIGIYEPSFYQPLKEHFKNGNHSLQKILLSMRVKKIKAENDQALMSIDSPELYNETLKKLHETK